MRATLFPDVFILPVYTDFGLLDSLSFFTAEMMLICVLKLCEQLNSKKADIFQVHFTYLLIGLFLD